MSEIMSESEPWKGLTAVTLNMRVNGQLNQWINSIHSVHDLHFGQTLGFVFILNSSRMVHFTRPHIGMLRLSCPKCNAWCEAPDIGLLNQVVELHLGSFCHGRPQDESNAAPLEEAVLPAHPLHKEQENGVYRESSKVLQKLIRESLPHLTEDPARQQLINSALEQLMEGINEVVATAEGQHMFEAAKQFADQMAAELTTAEKLKTVVILAWKLVWKLTSKPQIRWGVFLSVLGMLVTLAPVELAEATGVWVTMVIMTVGRGIVTCGVCSLAHGFKEVLQTFYNAEVDTVVTVDTVDTVDEVQQY